MTLKTRNRLYLFFFLLSLANFIGITAVFVFAAVNHRISVPDSYVRTFTLFSGKGIFAYSFPAVITSIFFFSIYSCVTSFIILKGFEKTQSMEVIYFLGFIVGSLTETARILMPLFELWQSLSTLLVVVGSTVLAGRMLCMLSLLFASLFSETDQRQNVERNLIILLVVSILFGVLFPLDTTQTTSTCTVLWGFRSSFAFLRILISLSTISVLVVSAVSKGNRDIAISAAGCVLLYAGHDMLCVSDCFIEMGLALLLLASGSTLYLTGTHRLYMWR